MRKKQRMIVALAMLACVTLAAVVAGIALRSQLSLFFTPAEALSLRAQNDPRVAPDRMFRLGGLVKEGSVGARKDDLSIIFVITDRAGEVPVTYKGVLPDLFREGQGVIVTGLWGGDGLFVAQTLLAKHDEKYMPPEVAKGLKKISEQDVEHLREQKAAP